MVTELLISKLREKIKLGLSEGSIKTSLMSEGWALSDIEEAFDTEVKGIKVKKPEAKKTANVWQYFVFTFLGVAVAVGGAFLWLRIRNNKELPKETVNEVVTVTPSLTPTPSTVNTEQAKPLEQLDLLASSDYIDQKDKYRIRPPKDWEVDTSGKLGAPVYFFGPVATGSGNFVYKSSISVLTGPANDNTLDGYTNFYLKGLGQRLEGFKVQENRKITVSGRSMAVVRDTFILEGQNFNGMLLLLVDQNKVFIVTGIALSSTYPKVKDEMDLSIYSFNVL